MKNGKIDFYCIAEAFDIRCAATQHAVKKLIAAGLRGKGDKIQDLKEARDAITEAIFMEEWRQSQQKPEKPTKCSTCYHHKRCDTELESKGILCQYYIENRRVRGAELK